MSAHLRVNITRLSSRDVLEVLCATDLNYNVDRDRLKEYLRSLHCGTTSVKWKLLFRSVGTRTTGFIQSKCRLVLQFEAVPELEESIAAVSTMVQGRALFQLRKPGWKTESVTAKWDEPMDVLDKELVFHSTCRETKETSGLLYNNVRDNTRLLQHCYGIALNYMHQTGDNYLLGKFLEQYAEHQVPCNCFINSYRAGKVTGIEEHVDHVKFVTVIVGIEESDLDGQLCPLQVRGEFVDYVNVPLGPGRAVAYGRLKHHVPFWSRVGSRITFNCFY